LEHAGGRQGGCGHGSQRYRRWQVDTPWASCSIRSPWSPTWTGSRRPPRSRCATALGSRPATW